MKQEDKNLTNNDEDGRGRALPLGIYQFEYQLIPQFLQALKKENSHPGFLLANLGNKQLLLKTILDLGYMPMFNLDDFNAEFKFTDEESIIVYTFPHPNRMPLAKYGAIVIRDNDADYYTLEMSVLFSTGDIGWVLGQVSDIHANLGYVDECETPDDFLNILFSKGLIHSKIVEAAAEGEKRPQKGLWSKLKKFFLK